MNSGSESFREMPAGERPGERSANRSGDRRDVQSKRETVSLVIPLFNEQDVVDILISELETFRQLRPEITEVVLVDDGSRDRTVELVRRRTESLAGYTLVRLSRNFGHQIAVTAGLEFVRTDAAIIMDADLQDPLEVAGRMIDRWQEGYDVVYGVRSEREGEGVLKRATAKMFYRFFRWITELDMPVDTGDFRLVSRDVIDAYGRISEHDPFVRGLVSWLGFDQIGITYERHARVAGSTKYPWRKMMDLAFKAVTSFSDRPLRLATKLGGLLSVIAFIGILWVLFVRLFTESAVPGWASEVLAILLLGGVQLVVLGIFGWYLARIYEEVKGRPRYVVKEVWEA